MMVSVTYPWLYFQHDFQWRSDAEIDATPIRVLRYVETEAETWVRLCLK